MLDLNHLRSLSIVLLVSPLFLGVFLGFLNIFPISKNIYFNKAISVINIFFIGISMLIAIYFLWIYYYINPNTINISWYKLAVINNIDLHFGFLLDDLNIIMITMVVIISFIINIYSIRYMSQDLSYSRFCSYMSFFVFSILLLIISDNFLQLFFGWELIGLASYLLINYYFQKDSARVAAFKAIIYNRIGDCSLILAIAAIFNYCGSLDYLTVFQHLPNSINNINLICGLLVVAAMTKSAQIPLHAWLPDAMHSPTPASALIHSATMVTVGVFILVRLSPILEKSPYWLNTVLIIGSTTALFMGILAMTEVDLKKIIAYSTISQLGVMMIAIGGSAYVAATFHLINHAFFKSLLFLSIGAIFFITDQNNVYKLPGDLKKNLPISYWGTLIASLSSLGFPGLSGFFSKELISQGISSCKLPFSNVAYYMLLTTTGITAFYNFRLFFLVFHNQNQQVSSKQNNMSVHRFKIIFYPVIVLALFSISLGILLFGFIVNNKLFSANIIISTKQQFVNVLQLLKYSFFSKTSLAVFCSTMISFILYIKKRNLLYILRSKTKKNFLFFYKILKNKYFFNHLNKLLAIIFKFSCKTFYEIIDQLLINQIVTNSISKLIFICSRFIRKLQTGHLHNYVFMTIAGTLVIILWLFFTII